MDINILVQRLRHGEGYTAQNEHGDTYQVARPPTGLMIKAADVIIQQNNQINQIHETSQNLMRQLNNLNEQYELLYKTCLTPETSTQARPTAGHGA
jgi:3-methyladenine DNA glycosylase/8-oxoguanine DNA glycosylase